MNTADLRQAAALLAELPSGREMDTQMKAFPGRLRAMGLRQTLKWQHAKEPRLAEAFAGRLGLGTNVDQAVRTLDECARSHALAVRQRAWALADALHLALRAGARSGSGPVAREAAERDPNRSPWPTAQQTGHVGLGMDKLMEGGDGQERGAALRRLLENTAIPGYREGFERWSAATPPADGRWVARMLATSRLLCGLGAPSPTENGLALHPLWGTPWIPGSSLKGITRAYTIASRGKDPAWDVNGEGFRSLFGTTPEFGGAAEGGCVDFLDAWWEPSPEAPWVTEVVTPHFQAYYQGNRPPDGMDSPIPSTFLAARGAYRVVLEGPEAWVAIAEGLLLEALEARGVGAKTRAGYGRLVQDGECAADRSVQEDLTRAAQEELARLNAEALVEALRRLGPTPEGFERLEAEGLTLDGWLRGEVDPPFDRNDQSAVQAAYLWLYARQRAKGLTKLPPPIGPWCETAGPTAPPVPAAAVALRQYTEAEIDSLVAQHTKKGKPDFDRLCRSLQVDPAQRAQVEDWLKTRGAKDGHLTRIS